MALNGTTPLPPKPWTVWMAVALLVVLCVAAVVLPLAKGGFTSDYLPFAMVVLFLFSIMILNVLAGHRWGRWLVVLAAMASLALLPIPGWRNLVAIVPLASAAILLHLPSSGRWFTDAVCIAAAQPIPTWWKISRAAFMALITVPAVCAAMLGNIVLTSLLADIPGNWKYHRLCSYPDKDALLAAEPDEVAKVIEFEQARNYTAFVFPPIGFMHFGAAVFVYDEDGHRVDCCKDVYGNPDFLKRWRSLRYRLRGLPPPPLAPSRGQSQPPAVEVALSGSERETQ